MSDLFVERIAEVRQRFVSRFDSRIEEIERAVLHGGGESGLDAIAVAHRQAHGLCGIGPTLGFVGTGKVARSIEQLLLSVVKAGRELTDDEIPRLREGLALLRSTAIVEMGSIH
jgi:HPt (histidine-containing phosphotransfer) domain-containing protein